MTLKCLDILLFFLLVSTRAIVVVTGVHDNVEELTKKDESNEFLITKTTDDRNNDSHNSHHYHQHGNNNMKNNDNDDYDDENNYIYDDDKKKEHSNGGGPYQVEIQHETHEIYPIIADISTAEFQLESTATTTSKGGKVDEQGNNSKPGSASLTGNDDGTVSSANSNRTPDFSMEVSEHVRVDLFCIIDTTFCERVAVSLRDAASQFNQVVNVKNDLV